MNDADAVPRVVPLRHPGRIVAAVLILLVLGGIVWIVVANSSLHWATVPRYLPTTVILSGLLVTLELTVLSMVIGVVLGTVLAVMRLSDNVVLRTVAGGYVWLVRGTPILVQIIFWFNIALFIPRLDLGVTSVSTNSLISPFTAALLGLALNEAAYMAEIVRGGILGVDRGQHEAATALGYSPRQTMLGIVLPQAMRVILPPTGNETIGMLKMTSLVSVIGAQDLLTRAQNISANTYQVIEMLLVATIWYVLLTTVATFGQYLIERRFARGHVAGRDPWALRVLRHLLARRTGEVPA